MFSDNNFINQRKSAILLALTIMILGTVLYFGTGVYKQSNMSSNVDNNVLELLRNVQLKAAYTKEGTIDMFAFARDSDLTKLRATQGKAIPKTGEMVLGNIEGSMMKKEGEFENIGDNIEDYNTQFKITGVLAKTETFADDFHFINQKQYASLKGNDTNLFIKFKDKTTPKLFYLYSKDDASGDTSNGSPVNVELIEGNMNQYDIQISGKKIYYPVILGYNEAKMMREEKLFTNVGDTIDNFFGKDIIIIGVIKQTNSSIDMMHLVQPDFFGVNTRRMLV